MQDAAPQNPLVTIITVVYNAVDTLEMTIQSVLGQSYENIQYIIVDGGSIDGTVDIISRYDARLSHWISERDHGIYDAMNKGISLAKGDYVGMLNADDFLSTSQSIQHIVDRLVKDNLDAVFSQLDIVDPDNLQRILRKYRVTRFDTFMLKIGVMPPHPTFYCRKSCYEKMGLTPYRTDYRIAADFEFLVRLLLTQHIVWGYLPETTVKMRAGGVSSDNYKSRLQLNREIIRACRENNLYTNYLFLLLKLPLRLLEYF